jgi:PAS domain S-box-containing protein
MVRFAPRSLGTKIALIAAFAVITIGAASFHFLQGFYRQQMIESLADSTTIQGELIEETLRYSMHTRSLDLMAEMVRRLANQKGVEKVMILDKRGAIRFSSEGAETGRVISRTDPTCMICHRDEPSSRGRTVIFEDGQEEAVFRNVNPILNSESCHGCHRPSDRVNGILLVDYSMDEIEASLGASGRKMWLAAIILVLAVTLLLLVLLRRMVIERVSGLARAIDSFRPGHGVPILPVGGADEISLLGTHLNRMMNTLDQSFDDLRRREAYLDSVINSAEDGIVVVDDQLKIVKANRAYESLRGGDRGDLIASLCCEGPICEARDPNECPGHLTLQSGETTRRIRTVVAGDGTSRHYEISASPLVPTADRPQVLEIWRDITLRRELEAGLAHSERLASLGFLASGISHEINNPLASITACLDGLRRRMHEGNENIPEELPMYLELIRGEVSRCSELSNRLRGLGKKPREVREAVDVRVVAEETIALVRFEAKKRLVDVEMTADAKLRPILSDESQIRQVLLNLLLNAIQAIDGRGHVMLHLAPDRGGVRIEVEDDGRGIEAKFLPTMFEPFTSSRPDARGSGLGLFISKVIIDQFGGSIAATSRLGQGTRFTVWIPTAAPLAAAANAANELSEGR